MAHLKSQLRVTLLLLWGRCRCWRRKLHVCNNEDSNQTFTVTEVDLSNAKADKSGHLRDRRVDVYTL